MQNVSKQHEQPLDGGLIDENNLHSVAEMNLSG